MDHDIPIGHVEDGTGAIVFENKMRMSVCRVEVATGLQLSVFINTEEMTTDHADGMPEMQIMLNDATLCDREPGKPDTVWTIPADIREAMQSVVDYALPDERADFDRSVEEGNDTDGHVYHALYKLDQWLTKSNA